MSFAGEQILFILVDASMSLYFCRIYGRKGMSVLPNLMCCQTPYNGAYTCVGRICALANAATSIVSVY